MSREVQSCIAISAAAVRVMERHDEVLAIGRGAPAGARTRRDLETTLALLPNARLSAMRALLRKASADTTAVTHFGSPLLSTRSAE